MKKSMMKKIAVTILSAGLLGGIVANSPTRAAEPSEAPSPRALGALGDGDEERES